MGNGKTLPQYLDNQVPMGWALSWSKTWNLDAPCKVQDIHGS